MKNIKTFEQFVNEDLVNENIMPSQMKKVAKDIAYSLPNHTKSKDDDGKFTRAQIMAAFKYVPNSKYINAEQKSEIADMVEKILGSSFIKESKINEAVKNKDVKKIMDMFQEFDGDAAEELFMALSQYYSDNEEELDNMNAKKISDHLFRAAEELRKRTGN